MTHSPTLAEALARGPVLLDGGLSNELEAAGHDLGDALWSARLLVEEPEALVAAHRAYLEAGARVVITASYQATFEGFARRGMDAETTASALRRSVELARTAIAGLGEDAAAEPSFVAASVGPYGAMPADGSEYRGRYGLTRAELERFHTPRLRALAQARPDVLALETMPDMDEAEALLRSVRGLEVPAWLSYSIAGERTRAGQPLDEAFALAAEAEEVIAVGVNCCAPQDVGPAVEIAARVSGKPVVAYPNSGERWDARARRWCGDDAFDPSVVAHWTRAGARLVGGCCRVGPQAIARLGEALGR